MKSVFSIYECVQAGGNFELGKLYPVLGWNNGKHVMVESENGDVIDVIAFDYQFGFLITQTDDYEAIFTNVSWKIRRFKTWRDRMRMKKEEKKWDKKCLK